MYIRGWFLRGWYHPKGETPPFFPMVSLEGLGSLSSESLTWISANSKEGAVRKRYFLDISHAHWIHVTGIFMVYLPTFGWFCGVNVGKYTSPMWIRHGMTRILTDLNFWDPKLALETFWAAADGNSISYPKYPVFLWLNVISSTLMCVLRRKSHICIWSVQSILVLRLFWTFVCHESSCHWCYNQRCFLDCVISSADCANIFAAIWCSCFFSLDFAIWKKQNQESRNTLGCEHANRINWEYAHLSELKIWSILDFHSKSLALNLDHLVFTVFVV